MSEPYLGEIRLFGITFVPQGWASCDGQLLQIQDNPALYSLIGTQFGGNGVSTFGLPDLRGRVPVGLQQYRQGTFLGSETVALVESEMGAHSHAFMASPGAGDKNSPGTQANRVLAVTSNQQNFYAQASASVELDAGIVSSVGSGAPHTNMQPFLALNFFISLQGEYPTRP